MSKRTNTGFTLIELVIVLVLLGILAAVAAPRFLDLSDEAEQTALEAQAGALSSASAVNFGKYKAAGDSTDSGAEEVTGCGNATSLMENFDSERFDVTDTATGFSDGTTRPFSLFVTNGSESGDSENTVDCLVGTGSTGSN